MTVRTTLGLVLSFVVVVAACSKSPTAPGNGSGNPGTSTGGTATPYIWVSYGGFVGASLSVSDLTPCPTPDCTIPDPPEIPRAVSFPGNTSVDYFYPATAGQSYAIVGTVQPRASGRISRPLQAVVYGVGVPATARYRPAGRVLRRASMMGVNSQCGADIRSSVQ